MALDNETETPDEDLIPSVRPAAEIDSLDHPGGDPGEWRRITQMPEFKNMLKAKRRFIIPATMFFILYYFALPVLVGYAPGLMSRRVFGVVNIAYLFALSQFFMAWIIAALYVRAAARFDKTELEIIETTRKK